MFPGLLGNEHIQKNLEAALSKGHISHFYLLSGPEGSGKHTLARLLAAAILCSGDRKPCLHCTPCRKVMDGTHPDFVTVDDPEKKTVPEPRVPLMQGSSPKCSAARARRGAAGI